MRLRIRKFYMDCVGAEGTGGVAYAAELRWCGWRLGYSALLAWDREDRWIDEHRWKNRSPVSAGSTLRWNCPELAVVGTWEGFAPLEERKLLETLDGSISWQVLQPAGPARLERRGEELVAGRGYAEVLQMDLPPWRLPFVELRWGRFVSDDGDRWLTWIDWREGMERRWCLTDTGSVEASTVGERGLIWPGGRLELEPRRTIRDRGLAADLLGRAAWLGFLLPGRIGRAQEQKWLSRGRLCSGREGWAIHERVRWR